MPELPEVEVTKRGISNALLGQTIKDVYISDKKLRFPLSPKLLDLKGATVESIERRAKYIVIYTSLGSIIIHLGMTGHLQIIESTKSRVLHDHFELMLNSGLSIRYNDTRRFGMVVFIELGVDPYTFPLLQNLGPEPLDDSFTAEVLAKALHKRSCSIKQALMDNKVVVGVGNIYASETLFLSKIHPERKANEVSFAELEVLVTNIKEVLEASILSGGTTIRDFEGADGKPGYFVQKLRVYGKANEPCPVCQTAIVRIILGQRATYFCPKCQK